MYGAQIAQTGPSCPFPLNLVCNSQAIVFEPILTDTKTESQGDVSRKPEPGSLGPERAGLGNQPCGLLVLEQRQVL